MLTVNLTSVARATIAFGDITPRVAAPFSMDRVVEASVAAVVRTERLTLEGYVPRGGYAQYGLIGALFEHTSTDRLTIVVPYLAESTVSWNDALAARVDDVRVGLIEEYAQPVLDAAAQIGPGRFPPGRLTIVEAAHGRAGSSEHFFRLLVTGALGLMLEERRSDAEQIAERLKALLVDGDVHAFA
jgi:hypothetical protein